MTASFDPTDGFYDSQGLRLHYVDWGNASAPPLVLVHGGRDHCRSWDWIARVLRTSFHIIAVDLRGHGDSDWAKGSSYSLADHIYDIARLLDALAIPETAMIAHSFGGMISMAYAGTFPQRVSRLAVLDGAFLRPAPTRPIDAQIAKWITDLERIAQAKPRRLTSIEEAAARMLAHNRQLTAEQAQHLACHAVKTNADGSLSWKFDPYQRVSAPYRLSSDDYIALWKRIVCPVLHLSGAESFMANPRNAGLLAHFRQAEFKVIAGAGHWLQHDRLDEVLAALRPFLGLEDR